MTDPSLEDSSLPPHLAPEHAQRLALLFLAVAYGADGDFHAAERATVSRLLARWTGDTEGATGIVDAAFVAIRTRPPMAELEASAEALRPVLSPALRREVLADLGRVARADGVLSVEEALFVRRLRVLWEEA